MDILQLAENIFRPVKGFQVIRADPVDRVFFDGPVDVPDKAYIFVLPADLIVGFPDNDLVVLLIDPVLLREGPQDFADPVLIIRVPALREEKDQVSPADVKEQ